MDEAGKMVSEDGTEVTVEGTVEDQEVEKDEDGQEVIKVYIFKADSGEDDMGEQPVNRTIGYFWVSEIQVVETWGKPYLLVGTPLIVFNSAGESVDISDGDTESVALTEASGQTLREKMVYMSVGDSHHNQGNHGE